MKHGHEHNKQKSLESRIHGQGDISTHVCACVHIQCTLKPVTCLYMFIRSWNKKIKMSMVEILAKYSKEKNLKILSNDCTVQSR